MTNQAYGWKPDLPDHRDFVYSKLFAMPVTLPKTVDLRPKCSPMENQRRLGSCTAQALVGALEFLENLKNMPFMDLSRLFVYYNERVIEGTVLWDSGAMLRDGVKTLQQQGVCNEKSWPYIIIRYKCKPWKKCYADALNHQITAYERINTLDEMRACLADGYPFVFGFSVYSSFESLEVSRTGVVNMPQPGERLLGGHAVMAVGYNDDDQRFIVRNSWGTDWGQKGYFTMPYAYLEDRNLSDDFWTIRDLEGAAARPA